MEGRLADEAKSMPAKAFLFICPLTPCEGKIDQHLANAIHHSGCGKSDIKMSIIRLCRATQNMYRFATSKNGHRRSSTSMPIVIDAVASIFIISGWRADAP